MTRKRVILARLLVIKLVEDLAYSNLLPCSKSTNRRLLAEVGKAAPLQFLRLFVLDNNLRGFMSLSLRKRDNWRMQEKGALF